MKYFPSIGHRCIGPLKFNAITPAMIKKIDTSFAVVAGSLNHMIPIATIKAVPTPAQIAYAILSSIFLRAKVSMAKLSP